MRTYCLVALFVVGCGQVVDVPDAAIDDPVPDAAVEPFVVVHLAPTETYAGTLDLVLTGDRVIDTGALSIDDESVQTGRDLVVAAQTDGPAVAVLRVRSLDVCAGASVRVVGSRPLVVIAETISIVGRLDAGATGENAGPGATDDHRGTSGYVTGQNTASGGGGGGAGAGGPGGSSGNAVGGSGGDASGDPAITILTGGSRGGPNGHGACPGNGGGGGGALQLSALQSLVILGTINAGGGAGSGGTCPTGARGASGGGSGGSIYLQSPSITGTGVIAANGGGGGGALGDGGNAIDERTAGGGPPGNTGGNGGAGGTLDAGAIAGSTGAGGGGGGGGAAGRIVIGSVVETLTFSPPVYVPPAR